MVFRPSEFMLFVHDSQRGSWRLQVVEMLAGVLAAGGGSARARTRSHARVGGRMCGRRVRRGAHGQGSQARSESSKTNMTYA